MAIYKTAINKPITTGLIFPLNLAYKKLDKAQAKHIVHKNYVARHKSNLAQAVNQLS